MKTLKTIAAFCLVLSGNHVLSQTKWTVDKAHSKVSFTVTHMMLSEVEGNFRSFNASITTSKEDFSDGVFELNADAGTISTDNEMRDNHLKGPEFFDVAKYPKVVFKSKSITKIEAKKYKLSGDLTMHGVTKTVSFDLTFNGIGKNMRTQKPVAGFKATSTIKRTDFGIGNMPSSIVSEEIELKAVGEFNQE